MRLNIGTALNDQLATMQALPVQWIENQNQFDALVEHIATLDWLALDTEFIKRDTYYPRLALVQINTGEQIYLLDAPKLEMSQFWQILIRMPLMIWHACGEDLGILYLLANQSLSHHPAHLPFTNVFDTQIALAFLTGQLQMGYQQAIDTQLGVSLDKAHSQSDWLARPLSLAQTQYAVDDVRYLPVLYQQIKAQLDDKQLVEPVWQDCQLYASELYEQTLLEDDATYLSMADFRYSPEQMAILQAVSSWREALARATNQPRPFILRKQAMREIVTNPPASLKDLTRTSIHRQVIKTYGEELLNVIRHAKTRDVSVSPAPPTPPYRSKDKTLSYAIKRLLNDWEADTGINQAVLMRKKWLAELYDVLTFDCPQVESFATLSDADKQALLSTVVSKLPEGLQGWRLSWVTNKLLPLLFEHQNHIAEAKGVKH